MHFFTAAFRLISILYNYAAYSANASFSSLFIRQGAPLGFKRFYAILNRFFVVLILSPPKTPTLYSGLVSE